MEHQGTLLDGSYILFLATLKRASLVAMTFYEGHTPFSYISHPILGSMRCALLSRPTNHDPSWAQSPSSKMLHSPII
jgi:hypothetical protein